MSTNVEEELARLRAENEALKASKPAPQFRPLTLKVSEKGALSLYGLGKFPTTLYEEQWLRLLNFAEEIQDFIRENTDKLKKRDQ